MKIQRLPTLTAGLLLCLFANAALAQYVWIDEKGVKQFSDMPPPASVPANRILKQPGGGASTRPADDQAADTADKAGPATKAPPTAAERNAEFKKRRAEQAEKEKKAAEQARHDADKAADCERARGYLHGLESGERIAQTNSNGERVYLDDEQRERELENARRYVAGCK